MKVHVDTLVRNLDGTPLMEGQMQSADGAIFGGKTITVGVMASRALNLSFPDEDKLPAEEKVQRFTLACRVLRSKDGLPVDLVAEDIALVKKCVGKAFGPLIVGQVFPVFEGHPNPLDQSDDADADAAAEKAPHVANAA
jgi:hypothetical protein